MNTLTIARSAILALAAITFLLVGCASSAKQKMPDEEDFFLELLDPMPRSTSGSFHAYSDDSYTVDKISFWSEFPSWFLLPLQLPTANRQVKPPDPEV